MAALPSSIPRSFPPSLVWILVFGPTLAYLLATRSSGLSVTGDVVAKHVRLTVEESSYVKSCQRLSSIVSLVNHRCRSTSSDSHTTLETTQELSYPLAVVQDHGFSSITSTVWRHDSELGRGYLLLADSQSPAHGRVWRWETGGGPIAIGKTLHLDQAGCRSGAYKDCTDERLDLGPGGMAIDFYNQEHFAEGRLVISEWGEGRIVRLEENGARTPLIYTVPDICSNETTSLRRVERPTRLQYTPWGDLFFLDHYSECQQSALWVLRQAVHVPALQSLAESRAAHYKWTHNWEIPELVLTADKLGDLVLSHDHKSLYVTVEEAGQVTLQKVALENDPDEEDDGASHAWNAKPEVVLRLEDDADGPGYIAVDQKGHAFWAVDDTIHVADTDSTILGRIMTGVPILSMTLGEDRFLYVATRNSLLRMSTKYGPSKVPTDMVKKRITVKATE